MRSSISLLVIALCIGMYFMYMKPAISDVKALTAQKVQYTNVLEKSQELNERRDQILTKYNSIPAEEIDKIYKIVPETYEPEIFLNDVNNLAVSAGLKIKNIKSSTTNPNSRSEVVADTSAPKAYKTNSMNVTFSGGYAQFLQFLSDLESSLHLIDIKSITVKSEAKDAKTISDTYTFEVALVSYSLK